MRKCTFGQYFEYQKNFENILFLESNNLYLTRLFKLVCDFWHFFYMEPSDVILQKNDVKVT